MWPLFLIFCYSLLVFAASLAGGTVPALLRLSHVRMQFLMSFVGGFMLGVALLHLVPHAVGQSGSLDRVMEYAVFGLLTMFFLIRIFHVHHHESLADDAGDAHHPAACSTVDVTHSHTHTRHHASPAPKRSLTGPLSWLGLALGLALHTLIDGAALAAAVAVESGEQGHGYWPAGLGTFLAVVLHKPLDSLSISSLMVHGGWSRRATLLVTVLFSLACPLGALLFYFGMRQLFGLESPILGYALAFAAGVFLCISLADILPELQFHTHDRVALSAALLVGVALAFGLRYVEPAHQHDAVGRPQATHSHE